MKFTTILGKFNNRKLFTEKEEKDFDDLVRKAEDRLSSVFTELSIGYDNKAVGNGFGGDPLVFQLVYPVPHICDARACYVDAIVKKFGEEAKSEIPKQIQEMSDEEKKYFKKLGNKLLTTAATDGKRYYWNPEFIMSKDKIGIRLVMCHEAWHAIYMQPSRRGGRHPGLWNIAIDFKVNFTCMEDLKARGVKDYSDVFKKHLGDYITFEEYVAILKDPYNPPARLAHFNPIHDLKKMMDPGYKHPGEDAPPMYYADTALSGDFRKPEVIYEYLWKCVPRCPECGKVMYDKPEEVKKLEKQLAEKKAKEKEEKAAKDKKEGKKDNKKEKHNHKKEQKDMHECGCGNKHEHKKEEKKEKSKEEQKASDDMTNEGSPEEKGNDKSGANDGNDEGGDNNSDKHNHGEGKHQCECGDEHAEGSAGEQGENGEGEGDGENEGDGCGHQCPSCGHGDGQPDPFGYGETLDDHISTDISEEDLNKRLYEAVEGAKRMAGKIPGGLEDELGELIAPKLTWQDFIRAKITKRRKGRGKNDWTTFKHRPLFAGLAVPQKREYFLNILAAYDCSGSMSREDISYGISQLQAIDEKGEVALVPWDSTVYWQDLIKVNKCDKENLTKSVVKGRGGTVCGDIFKQYEENVGKVDLIIVITDGFLYDQELNDVKVDKDTDVVWIITSHNPGFKPKFGRVFHLNNE